MAFPADGCSMVGHYHQLVAEATADRILWHHYLSLLGGVGVLGLERPAQGVEKRP
jgi:hypothetical protein